MKLLLSAAAFLAPVAAMAHEQTGPHLHPHGSEAGPIALIAVLAAAGAFWAWTRR